MKTLIHLTFHRYFFITVISKSDCATIENLRSCPKFGRNRTSTHEWTQTRTGAGQGIGLLSTSLLGTGVFAVPALAALVAGNNSLWAWPVLIILVFPIAIVFAILGRHYPSAGGVAHFVGMAFGSRLERVTGWLFLSVIPVGLPAALQIAAGFGQAMFGWHSWQLLLAELGTLALVWYIGTRGASSSANLQTVIAGLIVALIVAIWWAGDIKPANIPFPAPEISNLPGYLLRYQ